MMSTEGKQSSMPPSQDWSHTMIGDFTETTMSDSDNDLQLVRVTGARLDGQMPDIPEVEIWRTVSRWIFILSVLLTSSLLWISAQYKWCQHWLFPPPEIGEVEVKCPCAPYPLDVGLGGTVLFWDLWVCTFVYIERIFDCCHYSLVLYVILQPRGSACKVGDDVLARLQVTCPVPGNTHCM